MDLKFFEFLITQFNAVAFLSVKVASAFFKMLAIIFHKIAVLINRAKLIIGIKFCLIASFITHFVAFKLFTREYVAYA